MSTNKRKGKRSMIQPPSTAIQEEGSPTPSLMRLELHDSDSKRTISPEPSNISTPVVGEVSSPILGRNMIGEGSSSRLDLNDKRVFIRPFSKEGFLPFDVHRNIWECMERIFLEAVKTFNDAPQHMKDLWFNEFW